MPHNPPAGPHSQTSARRRLLPLAAFLDERQKRLGDVTRMVVGCCLFPRDRWMKLHRHEARVGEVGGRRRLEAIGDLLNQVGGLAVLGYADLPDELLPPGEVDATADIPRMSRTDFAWSVLVLSVVVKSVALLLRRGDMVLDTLELYYDRKDLRNAHRAQVEHFLRQELPEMAKQAAIDEPMLFPGDPGGLRLRVVRQVEKPPRMRVPDAYQRGVNLAHHLCAQSYAIISRGLSEGPIRVSDVTTTVRVIISRLATDSRRGPR
jgi:hypothetical protein